jgi:hypothetical protein
VPDVQGDITFPTAYYLYHLLLFTAIILEMLFGGGGVGEEGKVELHVWLMEI